jgi:hypothetical protein
MNDIDQKNPIRQKYYLVEVRYIDTISNEEIEEHGVPYTGVEELDKSLHQQWIRRYATVMELVEFHKNGAPVRFLEMNKMRQMYDDISAYLNAWKHELNTGINVGDAPIDFLIALDEFASSTYTAGKRVFIQTENDDVFGRYLNRQNVITAANLFKPGFNKGDINYGQVEKKELPKRAGYLDYFMQHKAETSFYDAREPTELPVAENGIFDRYK